MKLKLITAILMTLATVTWFVSALITPGEAGGTFMRWGLVAVFAVLAAFYWRAYFTMKRSNTHPSGTE